MEIFGQQLSWTEIIGTLFGITGVWLTLKKSIYCFPAGLVNVSLYAILFFESKLYADAGLQVFYIGLLVYGWFHWSRMDEPNEFTVTKTEKKTWIRLALICLAFTLAIGTVFSRYTDAALPYLDSLLTSMSLVAQWMIAKKKIENWLVWIVADILYTGMYVYKDLYLTALLYIIFILLAIYGYREWKKSLVAHERVH